METDPSAHNALKNTAAPSADLSKICSSSARSSPQFRRVKTPALLQMEAVECGAACLGIVLEYFGRYVPLEELRTTCGVSRDGTRAINILKAARHYGLTAKAYKKTLSGLQALALPFIAFWNANHWLVVEGFGPDRVYLNDPALGHRTVSYSTFDKSFSGVLLLCRPSADFIKSGTRPSAVAALKARAEGLLSPIVVTFVVGLLLLIPCLAMPALLSRFVDSVIVNRERSLLVPILGSMAAMALLQTGLTWFRQHTLLRIERRLAIRTSANFVGHLLRLPIEFFTRRHAGDLVARITLNERVAEILSHHLARGVLNLSTALFFVAAMFYYDWMLAGIGLLITSVNFISLSILARKSKDAGHRVILEGSRLLSVSLSGLQMIESIKASGRESILFARWSGYQAKLLNAQQEIGRTTLLLSVIPPLLTGLGTVAILTIGSWRIMQGELTVGMLIAFQFLFLSMSQPLHELVDLWRLLQEADGAMKRLDDIMECPIVPRPTTKCAQGCTESLHLQNTAKLTDDQRLTGNLELQDVAFGYNTLEPPLLKDLTLTLKSGSRVALVGKTGSGKSTLACIVAGLYEPWSGDVQVDGKPRSAHSRTALSQSVAFVSQETSLFEGTFRDNIALWDETITESSLDQAAQDACIYDDIMSRGAYDGRVGESGFNLSGGQRQRLEIARALVNNPQFLILDEATSALDSVTEEHIYRNLQRRDCSCLIITHRLSSLRDCDEIIVLEQGTIAQRGTHKEMIGQDGPYRQLIAEERDDKLEISSQPDSQALHPAPTFASFLDPINSATTDESKTGLIEACQIICDELGIAMQVPSTLSSHSSRRSCLEAIACESGFRVRRVALPANWWQKEHGPLLTYTQREGRTVVLLPTSRNRYRLINPTTATREHLTPQFARELATEGWTFYHSMPARATGIHELLSFGLRGCRRDIQVLLLTGLLGGLLALTIPLATGLLFDSVVPTGRLDHLFTIMFGLTLATITTAGCSAIGNIALLRLQTKMDATMQAALWDRLLKLPLPFHRRYSSGDLANRALGIQTVRNLVAGTILPSVLAGLFSLTSLAVLFYLRPAFSLIAVAFILLAALGCYASCRSELAYLLPAADAEGRLSSMSLELINGISKLRSAGAEARAFSRWSSLLTWQHELRFRAGHIANRQTSFQTSWPLLSLLLFCGFAAASSVPLQPAEFLAASVALGQLIYGCTLMAGSVQVLVRMGPLAERARPILTTDPEVSAAAKDPGRLSGQIEMQEVSFKYGADSPFVLQDLSLHIEPGEFVAIVGPSGVGKSSILRLLLGFEQPTQGRVLYDGQDLAELNVESIRQQIGVVLQDSSLEPGTLFENIAGSSELSLQQAWEAVRLAGIEEEIRQMPMQLQTLVVEGSTTFSGGQQQRLLIARAIAHRPRILLLDEATSALDNHTEAMVKNCLSKLKMTRIVIAHRMSTIAQADLILVVAKGQIVQSGAYPDLIGQPGPLQELAGHQF